MPIGDIGLHPFATKARWVRVPGIVACAELPKAAIVAYFDDRSEREVVADGRRAGRLLIEEP